VAVNAKAALRLRQPRIDRVLAEDVEVVTNLFRRGIGLSFRSRLERGRAMWINPCNGIHMFFMRFPIDVVFLDRENRVRSVHQRVKPWLGMVPFVPGAKSVIELPAGTLDGAELERGEQLEFEPAVTSAAFAG
jgi:uncharacterized membrane protein (UPF0127 family)